MDISQHTRPLAVATDSQLPVLDHVLARTIVEDAIRSYFRKRRSRVPHFVENTFSLRGALATHRHALGHDLWRAPLNAALAGPQIGLNIAAIALEQPPASTQTAENGSAPASFSSRPPSRRRSSAA